MFHVCLHCSFHKIFQYVAVSVKVYLTLTADVKGTFADCVRKRIFWNHCDFLSSDLYVLLSISNGLW